MTRQEAIKILKAKLACMERDMRGTDEDCNERNCLNCDLNYKQGTMGEQMEVLRIAIDALQSAQPGPLTEAKVVICKLYLDDLDKYKTCNEYKLLMGLLDGTACIQPEPEIYWGYTPTYERPLADDEIVPRLRDINAQLGGSYAIDRAIEVIEAVAERRTDE